MKSVLLLSVILLSSCTPRSIRIGPDFLQTVYEACNAVPTYIEIEVDSMKTEVRCPDGTVRNYRAF